MPELTYVPIDEKKELLLRASLAEQQSSPVFQLPLYLDLTAALALVANLQLALRHPANQGPSAQVARQIIDGVIERMETSGYEATAAIARTGDDPRFDQ